MSQLYKVSVSSKTLDDIEYKSVIILSAKNQEDVELQVRYFYEVQRQESFYIKKIDKVKDSFYQISCKRTNEDKPDMVQKLKENGINRFTPTNQNKNMNCISVGIAGVLHATDESHAKRYVGEYLISSSRKIHASSPFLNEGLFIFDPLGEVDPTRSPKVENIYKHIRLFNGGAPSLGK